MAYLVGTWNQIVTGFNEAKLEDMIYQDIPLALQIVRDHLDNDVDAVIVDDRTTQQELTKFIKRIAPDFANKIQLYTGTQDLFAKFEIENQLQEALSEKVYLHSGGSIIVESTQAMTVVDVNTGRYIGKSDLEETILKTNLEAAEEIVRQLRLRNIGGLIVIDFIDMASQGNRQKLFKHFERLLKERDKFQSVVLKISEFGLVQMTRKRSGKTLAQELTQACTTCHGLGYAKTVQTYTYAMLPKIKQDLHGYKNKNVLITAHPAIFEYLINSEYNSILELEKEFGCKIMLASDPECAKDTYIIST